MKYFKFLIILFVGLVLVGCQNLIGQDASTKPVFYERLETKDRKKLDFNFEAIADLDKVSQENDHKPHLEINIEIKNKTKIPVRFDLAHFQIVGLTVHPKKTNVITIKPGSTKKVNSLFKDVNVNKTPQVSPLIISYFAGKFELGKINRVKNQVELDKSILSEKHENDSDLTNKPNSAEYTDSQIIAWIGNVLTKLSNGHLTRDDYLYRVSDLGGIKIFFVQENHKSDNMKSHGADPNTSPIIYQLFLNDQGELEDYNTHEIFSNEYPG